MGNRTLKNSVFIHFIDSFLFNESYRGQSLSHIPGIPGTFKDATPSGSPQSGHCCRRYGKSFPSGTAIENAKIP